MSKATENTIPILDLSPQIESLWDEINVAVQRVLRSGRFIMGPEVAAFEQEVAVYLGVKHAIGVNSGTDALVISLRALGIGRGDEVITTAFSFFATAESISNVGARPVFVDIEEESMNINPELIEAAITPNTRAIMPVHLFGRPASMARITEIAKKHNLKVIEDCAQSFGARYSATCDNCSCQEATRSVLQNKMTGSIGDVAAFSFYPTKNLGAFGDGGLLVTDNDDVAAMARMLQNHGSKKQYYNEMLGYNSRLDSLQAAILRVKLPYVDGWNACRWQVAQRYGGLLSSVDGILTPALVDGHTFHQYTIRMTKANRDEVPGKLREKGVSAMVYYAVPLDDLPVYRGQSEPCQVSKKLAGEVLSLPIWPELADEQQHTVVDRLLASL